MAIMELDDEDIKDLMEELSKWKLVVKDGYSNEDQDYGLARTEYTIERKDDE